MKIPKALMILKGSAGANWSKIRKHLQNFLLMKKHVEELDMPNEFKRYFSALAFIDFEHKVSKMFSNYTQCALPKEKLISYTKNVLRTLNKNLYDSKIACYITDSYNTRKSGNKKYPNL